MNRSIVTMIVMLLLGCMAARATDMYTVHLLHTSGLQPTKVMSPDGTTSSSITSLSVRKGDKITFVVDNAFTPAWKYSTDVTDIPFKLSDPEAKALKELVRMIPAQATSDRAHSLIALRESLSHLTWRSNSSTKSALNGSKTTKALDSLRHRIALIETFVDSVIASTADQLSTSATIESRWVNNLARLDSVISLRSLYDKRRERGELSLSKHYYEEVRGMIASIRDTLAQIEKELERADMEEGRFYGWVNDMFKNHLTAVETELNATISPSSWTVESTGDEQVVVIYARDRRDTTRVVSLELRLNVAYPRPAFSLDPTLAVLILQSGLFDYTIATDSSGKATLKDSTTTTGVVIRPAVQFTFWPWSFGRQSNWAVGPSLYFGYAHDFVFDIGASLTLAYRDIAQVSIGYVSASMPQSVSGQVQADTPIPDNAVLSYRRVPSMVLCLSIQGLAF